MKLSFAQPAYIYSNTDLSIESPYAFIASEGVVQHCSQQFSVITQKSFKLFKLKKSYAGAQIIVPVSEKTLDYMNMINMYNLNFDRPYPNPTFTVVIWNNNSDVSQQLQNVENNTLCVKGMIEEYKGKPQMIVGSLEQII